MIRAALWGFAAGLAVAVWAWSFGMSSTEAKYAAEMLEMQADNIAKQKALVKGVQKVAEDADKEQLDLEHRLAGADQSLERLRQAVRNADARADSATTAVADAVRARAIIAHCAERYRDVAERADRLRGIVLGLQAYARTVTSE